MAYGLPYTKNKYDKAHTCIVCSQVYYPEYPASKYCTIQCKSKAHNLRIYKSWEERGRIPDSLSLRDRRKLKAGKILEQPECAICGRPFDTMDVKQVHVDHDHSTGKIRDLLCSSCNQGLGNFKDDPEIVQAAIDYLNKWK